MAYSHRVVALRRSPLPPGVAERLTFPKARRCCTSGRFTTATGGRSIEDRWINPGAVPEMAAVDFRQVNANEWLVRNAPYLRADLTFAAANADARDARLLGSQAGQGAAGSAAHDLERPRRDHHRAARLPARLRDDGRRLTAWPDPGAHGCPRVGRSVKH